MTKEELLIKLKQCKQVNLDEINPTEIDEIEDIKIDKRKSSNDRLIDFLNEVKNPYIFKVEGKLVQIDFVSNGKTADECLTNVLKNLYK